MVSRQRLNMNSLASSLGFWFYGWCITFMISYRFFKTPASECFIFQINLWWKIYIFLKNETSFFFPRTPDEDFSILLEAAVMYDRRVAAVLNEDDSTNEEFLWKEISDGKQYVYPRLLFIITGNNVSICMHICASVLTHTHTHIYKWNISFEAHFLTWDLFFMKVKDLKKKNMKRK